MTTEKQTEEQRKDDLDRLQQLLLGEDRSRLNLLDKRVSDFESRSCDVAEVLSDAFERVASDPMLEVELEKPIMHTIRSSIKRDSSEFAQLLFPIIGPAIRRAVADALKSLVQSINEVMENSFSVKGLRWRMEAARTGVPFAQIVLIHTMRFALQETFLIAKDTGIVLAHAHRDENLVLDEDAVAAMLTAIQSFIQDSLGISSDDPLRSAELGNRTLWVINGPEAILACVISGSPPRALRDELMALLESIHARYGERLTETDDALANDMGMRVLMQQSLREEIEEQEEETKRSKAYIYWAIAILLLIALTVWKSWQMQQQYELDARVVDLFRNQPGYVVSSSDRKNGQLFIDGLRDPGTATPVSLLNDEGLTDEDLVFRFKPFLSLEPGLVLKGLRTSLGLTDSTGLVLNGDTLQVVGLLSADQADRLAKLTGIHPLINGVDLSGTKLNAEEALQLARVQLAVPDSVELMTVDGRISVSGRSNIAWYLEKSSNSQLFGGWEVDFKPLFEELKTALHADTEQLNGAVFFFSQRDRLTPESSSTLDAFAQQLSGLLNASTQLDIDLTISLVGRTDGTGTPEQNERTSRKRVGVVQKKLVSAGINPENIQSENIPSNSDGENQSQRSVSVQITGNDLS